MTMAVVFYPSIYCRPEDEIVEVVSFLKLALIFNVGLVFKVYVKAQLVSVVQ